ncbi:MAG: flavohemoglobin expression-modulating QEGLA motif protein, partial [Flavobacteriaceae bacterium]|nr:flavohemoglobin expression-modulating QEGLA motif protein [Flavobacteriaceae bacterium]
MNLTKDKILLEIDKKIDFLVKKIELLNYINPTNIEEEKARFFNSKFTVEPNFKYPNLEFNSFELQRQLFAIKIEEIEDTVLRKLYEDIIYEYSGLIECIDTISEGKKFYYNSLRSFGTPTEIDVENAKFILHFKDETNIEKALPRFDVHETEQQFRAYSKRYDFTYTIKHSDKLSAIAMVLNNQQTLVLNSNHTFSQNDIDILTNHEIGVHMVTTMNSLRNKLKIFSHGFPNNTETQEGLAVYAEFMSNSLNIKRLKT